MRTRKGKAASGSFSGATHGLRVMVATAYRGWPGGAVGVPLAAACVRLTPLITGYLVQRTIDGAIAGDSGAISYSLSAFAGVMAATGVVAAAWIRGRAILAARSNQSLRQVVLERSLGFTGIEHLENPAYADRAALLLKHANPGLVLEQLAQFVLSVMMLGIALFFVGRISFLSGVALVVAVVVSSLNGHLARLRVANLTQASRLQRLSLRFFEIATARPFAKEVRVFGLGPELRRRHQSLTDQVVRQLVAGRWRAASLSAGVGTARALAVMAAAYLIIRAGFQGLSDPGNVVLGLILLRAAMDTAGTVGREAGGLVQQGLLANHALSLLRDSGPDRTMRPASPPLAPFSTVAFENVSFTYPGTDKPVLSDVSFTLSAGSTVVVAGVNGSGKSTLVKLLAGLYTPTSGRIIVDGIDLQTIDPVQWQRRLAVTFQDYVNYEFSARETVGVGHLPILGQDRELWAALQMGGAAEVVHSLPRGLSTQLGRDYPRGAELSGGQWQRLSVARGLTRPDPCLVVLDEPTSRVDPAREREFVERFGDRLERSGGSRQMTVIVSHRLAVTQLADTVVLLDRGRVLDVGSPDDVVPRNPRYAALLTASAAATPTPLPLEPAAVSVNTRHERKEVAS